ncbi:RluA family pseudouridine synthase [Leptolinea tardivitalis]|nr:RluA family pseudouridine synthase [Leptolinea tardivitalis]GAP20052.1 ribosomal large subunit pseudouridine synthase D [Leptolinea tardivitalis]
MTEKRTTFVFSETQPMRLDVYLTSQLPHLSRSRIQNLIRDFCIEVNGQLPQKTGMLLEGGEEILVIEPEIETASVEPENIPLDIIFENDDLLIINKPAGMVVHPAIGHFTGTLVNAALGHDPDLEGVGGEKRPGIVHRLDKDTSGLIVIAKNDSAHQWLQGQFKERTVKKTYITLVDGHPRTPNGRIETPIGRDPSHRQKMAVTPESRGRPSVTEYFTRETFPQHTLLEVHILTGRTHQIRVHMAFVGCPVAGDTVYGRKKVTLPLTRQFLHASRLEICLPGENRPRTFEAPLPVDLQTCLDELRKQ